MRSRAEQNRAEQNRAEQAIKKGMEETMGRKK
jgi:hypothetical protein